QAGGHPFESGIAHQLYACRPFPSLSPHGPVAQIDTGIWACYSNGMPKRTTINVSLTPEFEKFVEAEVASGRYQSASEVYREGLRFWRVLSYLVVYLPDSKPLFVVRVLHAARDVKKLLEEDFEE